MTDVVILADGEFPRRPDALERLRRADVVVCCDGAAAKLLRWGREPDWIVGDLDSVAPEIASRFAERVVRVAEQETNDLAKAFRFCRERGLTPAAVLGAAGGREDHLLGNLSRFAEAAPPGCRLISERGCFVAFAGRGVFAVSPGTPVSVFSFDPGQKFASSGLKYPLDGLTLPYWHSGTLNVAEAAEIVVTASTERPVLLFFAD